MPESIKNKAIKGVAWSGLEKFTLEISNFLVGIIIARILFPSDYGTIGILLVFTSFSMIFIEGGMSTALIQKTNRTEDDYNTVYIYNIAVSVFIYIALYLFSPAISKLYDNDNLTILIRVISLILIISSLSSVHNTKLVIDMNFKKISLTSIISGVTSGISGIYIAYKGFGVWALVFQQIVNSLCRTVLLIIFSKWKPKLTFSKDSFCDLFGFGYKLVLTNILARTYTNLYPLIIGKLFPFKTLGLYTRANQYAAMPAYTLGEMFLKVSFPAFSSIKTDENRLKAAYRKYITLSSSVIFPVMFLLAIIAHPLIVAMLTNKWEGACPFLQIFCMGVMFDHISSINLHLLFVKGRSDLALKLEVLKKSIAISLLILSSFWGIWAICIIQSFYSFIATFLNSIYTKRMIGIGYMDQLEDFGRVWLLSLVPALISYSMLMLTDNYYLQIILCSVVYFTTYITLYWIYSREDLLYCISSIKEINNRK